MKEWTSEFADKTVLLTGGGGEIGVRTAEFFVRSGAKVISTDLKFPCLTERIDFGANPVKIGLDVTDEKQIAAVVDATLGLRGGIDVVVNAAGILNVKPFLQITEKDWERTFAV